MLSMTCLETAKRVPLHPLANIFHYGQVSEVQGKLPKCPAWPVVLRSSPPHLIQESAVSGCWVIGVLAEPPIQALLQAVKVVVVQLLEVQ